jgi:Cdc6-like AAA superfamily ATPase
MHDKETKKPLEELKMVYLYRTFLFENGIVNTYINFDTNQLLVDIFSSVKESFEDLTNFFKKNLLYRSEEDVEKQPVYVLQSTPSGLSLLEIGGVEKELERGNYDDEVLKKFDLLVADINSDAPKGRIGILTGDPGTGKSWFIKGLIKKCEKAKFVVVQPDMMKALTGPDVVSLFVQEKNRDDGPVVLIVEDGDICIQKRQGSDLGLVSAVLNMGDGILGQLLDIRIIVTSNIKHGDLDDAIIRPGRLSEYAEFKPLPESVASDIYARETGDNRVFNKPMTLAEVYNEIHSKKDAAYTPPPKKKKIGFGND